MSFTGCQKDKWGQKGKANVLYRVSKGQAGVKKLDPLYDKLAPTIGYNLIDEIKKLRKKYENTK